MEITTRKLAIVLLVTLVISWFVGLEMGVATASEQTQQTAQQCLEYFNASTQTQDLMQQELDLLATRCNVT